jgi:Tol biopolymer transport system component
MVLLVILTIVFAGVRAADRPASEALYEKAYEAWDTGDYVSALLGFDALLRGADATQYFERIALLTGELFEVTSIAPDGRNLRFSPDGRVVSYETGSGPKQVIHLIDAENGFRALDELKGANAVFSPAGNALALQRLNDSGEMEKLRKDLAAAESSPTGDYMTTMNLRSRLRFLEAKGSEIVLSDIPTGRETVVPDGGLLKGEMAFSVDGRELYFVGAKEADTASNDIYAVPIGAGNSAEMPRPLTSGPGFKVAPVIARGGKCIVYSITTRSPFSRPAGEPQPVRRSREPDQSGQPPLRTGQAEQPTAPSRPVRTGAGQSRRFAVLNLADGSTKAFEGTFSAISTDGAAVAFIGREGSDNTLSVLRLEGDWAPKTIKRTPETINSAAFSPDGSKIAFEMTWTRNAEIFLIRADGTGEIRLSREIENDRDPRFLSPTRVLAIKGESRYSRAHLYDTESLSATRLFHNNTVRTLSMEYEWAPDLMGKRILIAAQRNGETMVNERGVYLLDLDKKISVETLLARIKANLASERALRAKAEAMFKPIAGEVRAVTSRISTTRVYGYEKALFNFDSKHVTQPGNQKAAEYIFNTFVSFGYKPEYQWVPNRPVKTANVVAVLEGTDHPDLYYVLSSHYDSNARGPGADDNSSATAALLETARLLAGRPLPASVVFAAFTGEESGFWGSREFVRLAKERNLNVMAALNNDMVGWTDDNRLDDTIRYTNEGIRDILHAAAIGFTRLITYDTHYIKSTDAVPLYEAWGDVIGGLGSYPLLGNPYYHQPSDLLETVNHQLVTEVARVNAASVMLLASSPSPVKGLKVVEGGGDRSDTVEVTWTPNPEKDISHYLISWGPAGKAPLGSRKVKEPRALLKGLKAKPGEKLQISVRAVNLLGLASWDPSRVELHDRTRP